jgi:hypothetical protein
MRTFAAPKYFASDLAVGDQVFGSSGADVFDLSRQLARSRSSRPQAMRTVCVADQPTAGVNVNSVAA